MKTSRTEIKDKSSSNKILLVDDDHDILQFLKQGLELKGLQVNAYTSAQEALQYFKPDVFDLAILDIRMPDMNGFQLYREIKKRDHTITAYFLSAFEIHSSEFKKVFPSLGEIKAIIKKPVSILELLNQIAPSLKISAAAKATPK
ncbi:MAG: response regulator [Thermoproteota archaeon]|nr:response regulator [Thermoproteota archaeon]